MFSGIVYVYSQPDMRSVGGEYKDTRFFTRLFGDFTFANTSLFGNFAFAFRALFGDLAFANEKSGAGYHPDSAQPTTPNYTNYKS